MFLVIFAINYHLPYDLKKNTLSILLCAFSDERLILF